MTDTRRISPIGPPSAKIAFVGEAPGEREEKLGIPFVGPSGQELDNMCSEAEINPGECWKTNVFMSRPEGNRISELQCNKSTMQLELYDLGVDDGTILKIARGHVAQGKYFKPSIAVPELFRLREELQRINPNVIVPLGNTACWALLGTGGITKLRGTAAESVLLPGKKCVATYHPAAILRNWSWRIVTAADLQKVARESGFPDIRRPRREIMIPHTAAEIIDYHHRVLSQFPLTAVDIETPRHAGIACIGFSPNHDRAMVVPFVDRTKPGWHYWPTLEAEIAAFRATTDILRDPKIKKIFQNGLFDLSWIWREWKCPVFSVEHDTMLLHHALMPELPKGLGFMGSIHTDEVAWKDMRKSSGKREE